MLLAELSVGCQCSYNDYMKNGRIVGARELKTRLGTYLHRVQGGATLVITDRGRPAHVLLTFGEYKKITGGRTKIADLLAMPGIDDAELESPPLRDLAQPADLS